MEHPVVAGVAGVAVVAVVSASHGPVQLISF